VHFTLTPRYSWMPSGDGIANTVDIWSSNMYAVDERVAAAATHEIRQALRRSAAM
jgi:hypothetical protein